MSGEDRSHWSVELSLQQIARDPVGAKLLCHLTDESIEQVAQRLYEDDSYHCAAIARRAASIIRPEDADRIAQFAIGHQLWCSHRAAVASERSSLATDAWTYKGLKHVADLDSQPKILLTPMTVCLADVLAAMASPLSNLDVVLYGEEYESIGQTGFAMPENFSFAGHGAGAAARIVATLKRGGAFCTYADFVYPGHATVTAKMFGQKRKLSRSFVGLCLRSNVHMVPVLLGKERGELVAEVLEPFLLDISSQDRLVSERIAAQVLANVLADLIARRPEQWLLLGTLSASYLPDRYHALGTAHVSK